MNLKQRKPNSRRNLKKMVNIFDILQIEFVDILTLCRYKHAYVKHIITYFSVTGTKRTMIKLLILSFFVTSARSLIGYDCGSRNLNVTTLSLINIGECDIPAESVNVTSRYIQLLQLNEFTDTKVLQCKVEIHRTIYHCGMHSHISIVQNGETNFIREISREACQDAHLTGTIVLGNDHVIRELRVNQTSSHSATFAGFVNSDGRCNGSPYSDPYGTWESVVVQGTVKISLFEFVAEVSLDNNEIHLKSGTVCRLSDAKCIDNEGGYTFWRTIPEDNCKFSRYGILYEGIATKMTDDQVDGPNTIYSLTTQGITFALATTVTESVCGYTIIRTEHPKLSIFETTKGVTFAAEGKLSVSNMDMFAYVNSKFVYVEKFIRIQLQQLYRDVITQKCTLEKQTLRNALSIASQAPDEFAYNLMKGPGYMAVVAGEAVHIIKCIPVEVKLEHGPRCYAELQVNRDNTTYFLSPKTHILKRKGTEVACNALLPSHYLVGETWYKILPRATEAVPPQTIKPMTRSSWKYISPAHLATSGIYTEEDLKDLRNRIYFPMERTGLLNDLALGMQGHPVAHDSHGSIMRLLDEDVVSKLAESTWEKVWRKFTTFGTVSAGVIAMLLIIRVFKIFVDIAIRGYTLHTVYEWSLHLLGAIWSSIAHLLLQLHRGNENIIPDVESQIPMQPNEIASAPKEKEICAQNSYFSYNST